MQNNQRFLNLGLILAALLPATTALVIAVQMLGIAWPDLEVQQKQSILEGLVLTLLPAFLTGLGGYWYLRRATLAPVKLIVVNAITIAGGFYVYLRFVHVSISVAEWIFDQGDYLTVLLSAVIPIFFYLLYYLAALLRIGSRRSLLINIIAVVVLPFVTYLSFNVFRGAFSQTVGMDLSQLFTIALTTVFSFVLIRLLLHFGSAHASKLSNPRVVWVLRLVFIGIMPVLGLLLNEKGPVARESQMVLGKFTASVFWLLTFANAIVYLIPNLKIRFLQNSMVILRLAGLAFVLYFCVVFILFLPLALLLIAAIGLGFLLLIPYFAAAMQLFRLREDFSVLRQRYSRLKVIGLFALGLLILPTIVIADMYLDRLMLVRAIDYVQNPPLKVNQQPRVEAATVLRLSDVRAGKSRRRRQNESVPIYDALYRRVVLDGAELSEGLRAKLRQVFLGENSHEIANGRARQGLARVSAVAVESKPAGAFTESTLRIRIVNNSGSQAVSLDTNISLPDHAFLTQHWLTIESVEVPAQITARSTALWVYNRVTERLQDPSLIYYERANQLRWKVFPVPAAGFRLARLHFKHAGDAELMIGDKRVLLRAVSPPAELASASGKFSLLAPAKTEFLAARKPYLHLVVDCSSNASEDYRRDAELAAQYLGLSLPAARVSYVNSSIRTGHLSGVSKLQCADRRHGFFLDMALRSLIYEQNASSSDSFPVFAILSPTPLNVGWNGLSYLMVYYGDADAFVHVTADKVVTWSFSGKRVSGKPRVGIGVRRVHDRVFSAAARLLPTAFDGEKSALLNGAEFHHAYVSGEPEARVRAVLSAIETGTLNAAAGSIVLETEAQRLKLAELHSKMLSARNELDTGERPRMSEPSLFLLLILILPLWIRRRLFLKRKPST